MFDLASRSQALIQGAAEALNNLPWWAALAILFLPTLLALWTRRVVIAGATAVLNGACLILMAPSITPAATSVILLFALSLVAALYGFRERERDRMHSALEARLERVREQMMVFLEALDRRTQEIDKMRNQAPVAMPARAPDPPPASPSGVVPGAYQTTVSVQTPPRQAIPTPPPRQAVQTPPPRQS